MKKYRISPDDIAMEEHEDGDWVPASVAQGLYDALVQAREELEDFAESEYGGAYINLQIDAALDAADGDSDE
ncbi:hypothetical protein [Halomonas sp. MS1]|nr:hypothetical protein [Halomonas sp. MS1]UTD55902.1 hypothetical protein NF683_01400 [Halomonas sp. MS1]